MRIRTNAPFARSLFYACLRPLFLSLCLLAESGCSRPSQSSKAVVPAREAEDTFSVADAFRKATDLESYRTAVQQVNLYLAAHPEIKVSPLSREEQDTLQKEYALDDP